MPKAYGVQTLALLRPLAYNLLRTNGFRSSRAGLMAVTHDINRMHGWSGIQSVERDYQEFQSSQAIPPPLEHQQPRPRPAGSGRVKSNVFRTANLQLLSLWPHKWWRPRNLS